MQSFLEVLMDGSNFKLDPELGIWCYRFGENEKYSLEMEPLVLNQGFHVALYERDMPEGNPVYWLMWTNKLPMKPGYSIPHGPGEGDDQPPARRKAIRAWLVAMLAEIDKADEEAAQVGKS